MDPNQIPDWPHNNNGEYRNYQLEEAADSSNTTPTTVLETTSSSTFIHIDHESAAGSTTGSRDKKRSLRYWVLLLISYSSLVVGSVSSSLLSRLYFIHGGKSRWVSTWVQSAGFPLLLIPIYCFPRRRSSSQQQQQQQQHAAAAAFSLFTPKLFLISVGIGIMLGFNNFLYSWGVSYLPISTASLLLSTQLAFNLILSVIIVKQNITFTNFNCVVLLTLSSVLLALTSSHDRPQGVTQSHYLLGFFAILGAGLLFALYLPLVDLAYRKLQVRSYEMVIEMQLVMEIAATVFATLGMAADGGFREMKRESQLYDLAGSAGYWLTLGFSLFCWQLCFMGTAGLVFLTTSLNGGICMTALLPMNVLGGVLAYGDAIGGSKVISTLLCVWGFCSYLYGEYIKMKNQHNKHDDDDDDKEMSILMMRNNNNQPPDELQMAAVSRDVGLFEI